MRGLIRPCHHNLSPELFKQWQSHLCGTCLSLRDVAGQASRALTSYDTLLPSVLLAAQTPAGSVETRKAGPCALRGFRTADVVSSSAPPARLAATAALLGGSAHMADKVADDECPPLTAGGVKRTAVALRRRGESVASSIGFDGDLVTNASARTLAEEQRHDASVDEVLTATGEAVGSVFAHTASLAGRHENRAPLAEVGMNYGKLVHLLDAMADRRDDRRRGRYNPLEAKDLSAAEAATMADAYYRQALDRLELVRFDDGALVDALFRKELGRTVGKVTGTHGGTAKASMGGGGNQYGDWNNPSRWNRGGRSHRRRDEGIAGGTGCFVCCCPCDCCPCCCDCG